MKKSRKIIIVTLSVVVLLCSTLLSSFAYTYDRETGVVKPSTQEITLAPLLIDGTYTYTNTFRQISNRSQVLMLFEIMRPNNPYDPIVSYTIGFYRPYEYTQNAMTQPNFVYNSTTGTSTSSFTFEVFVDDRDFIGPVRPQDFTHRIRIEDMTDDTWLSYAAERGEPITIRISEFPTPTGYNDISTYVSSLKDERINQLLGENENLNNLVYIYEAEINSLNEALDNRNALYTLMSGLTDGTTEFLMRIGQWEVGGISLSSILVVAVSAAILFWIIKVARA